MKSPPAGFVRQLIDLGLTDLEARAYAALVAHGGMTAYQLAQRIGKPTANVYKAVRSLAAKGAAATQRGRRRVLVAIPPDEFLGRLRRRHAELIEGAARSLRELRAAPDQPHLYALEDVESTLERARAMLTGATAIAVVDAFPLALESLRGDIERASARGVKVFVQAYEKVRLRAASLVIARDAEQVVAHWASEQLNVVTDGRQVLLALCTRDLDAVIQAYWSDSLYLACMTHAGLLREHAFHQMGALLDRRTITSARLRAVIRSNPTFHTMANPGQRELAGLVRSRSKELS